MSLIDQNYTSTHAVVDEHHDAPGPLPRDIELPDGFLAAVIKAINPAESHWANKRAHEFQKNSIYNSNFHLYIQCFYELICLAKDAMNEIIESLEDVDWPFIETADDIRTLMANLDDLQARQKVSNDTAYINLPFVAILALDMLKRMDDYVDTIWAEEEMKKFSVHLNYPVSDRTSYSLNIIYAFKYKPMGRAAETYHFLCGYRLGRTYKWTKRNGDHTTALYLEPIKITTLHPRQNASMNPRRGYTCALRVM